MLVYLFTMINVALSNVFLITGMSIVEHFMDTVPGSFDLGRILNNIDSIEMEH